MAASIVSVACQGWSASDQDGLPEVPDENELRVILDMHLSDAMLEAGKRIEAYARTDYYLGKDHVNSVTGICVGLRDVLVYFERHKIRYGEESASKIRLLVRRMFVAAEKRLSWIKKEGITGPAGSPASILEKIYDRINDELNDPLLKVE